MSPRWPWEKGEEPRRGGPVHHHARIGLVRYERLHWVMPVDGNGPVQLHGAWITPNANGQMVARAYSLAGRS